MAFDSEKYMHESDRAALKALKAIPGFSTLLKSFMNVWNERQQRILNMSSRIKIGENQMKKYYDMLPPICEKLGIPVPELYLEMNVVPNSYTSGDTNPFIVITSGLLKTLPEELIPTILAHECGHIACHHVLYLTMGRLVLQGAGSILSNTLPFGNLLTAPLQLAFYYWMRCSEFSADRVAVLCDETDRKMEEVCLRLAGWDKEINAEVSLDAFLDQAADYKDMINESKWNKALEFMILSQASHPLMAVRATECRNWYFSKEYQEANDNLITVGSGFNQQSARIEIIDTKRVSSSSTSSLYGIVAEKWKVSRETALIIPEDYKRLEPKPTDPDKAKVYGHVNTQSNCIVQVFPISSDESICNKSMEQLVQDVRDSLADDEGIISVDCGTTQAGKQYAFSIIKTRPEPRCIEYKLAMHISMEDSVTAIIGYFMETGSPGFRESTIKGQLTRKLQGADLEPMWCQDPYDPEFSQGLLMNESEKEKYDIRFPLNPLTEARKFITAIISHN